MDPLRNLKRWLIRRRAKVCLLSFHKCGRTWLVFMIGSAIKHHYGVDVRNPLDLGALHRRRPGDVPLMVAHHDGGPQHQFPEDIETDKGQYRDKRVLFLVRDPRDVLVSAYFQKTRRNISYAGELADFIDEARGSLRSNIRFYNIWADNRDVPEAFLLVTYEDLKARPREELRRVLDFIGLAAVSDDAVARAVDDGRFDNMRRLETANALGTGRLAPRDAADTDSYKTRRGVVGGYVDYLSPEQVAHVDAVIRDELSPYYGCYLHPAAVHHEAG